MTNLCPENAQEGINDEISAQKYRDRRFKDSNLAQRHRGEMTTARFWDNEPFHRDEPLFGQAVASSGQISSTTRRGKAE